MSLTLFFLLILIVGLASVIEFNDRLNDDLKLQERQMLQEFSEQNNHFLQAKLRSQWEILSMVTDMIGKADSLSEEEVSLLLQTAVKTGGFDRVGIADCLGNERTDRGISLQIGNRDYFQRAFRGETVISDPVVSVVTGEPVIVLSMPLTVDGTIEGVVCGTYSIEKANEILLKSYRTGLGDIVIVKPDGTVVLHNGFIKTYQNAFSYLGHQELLDEFSVDKLKEEMANDEKGSFWIRDVTGDADRNRLVNFVPTGINDWYSISIVSDEFLQYQKSELYLLAFGLLGKVILLLAVVFVIEIMHVKKVQKRNEQNILIEKEKYLNLLSRIGGGIVLNELDKDMKTLTTHYINDYFTSLTGFTFEDIEKEFECDFLKLIHPEDLHEIIKSFFSQTQHASIYQLQYRLLLKTGEYRWVMDFGSIEYQSDGQVLNQVLISDISKMKEQEELIHQEQECLHTALELANGCAFAYNLSSQTYMHIENTEPIFGCSVEKFLQLSEENKVEYDKIKSAPVAVHKNYYDVRDMDIVQEGYKQLREKGRADFEVRINGIDDQCRWCQIRMVFVYSSTNTPTHVIGNIVDIHEVKEQLNKMKKRAEKDFLTGLYNKGTVEQRVNEILYLHVDKLHGLILLDIDGFKNINDNLGHIMGDELLHEVGIRLNQLCRDEDIAGRIGGDEFIVFCQNIPNREVGLKIAERILQAFTTTISEVAGSCRISCSIGIAFSEPETAVRFAGLYQRADGAMYQAKKKGKNQYCVAERI